MVSMRYNVNDIVLFYRSENSKIRLEPCVGTIESLEYTIIGYVYEITYNYMTFFYSESNILSLSEPDLIINTIQDLYI